MRLRATLAGGIAETTRYWWVLLITGTAWVLLSLAILQFDLTSIWSIAVLTGLVMLLASAGEFALAFYAPRWRFAHGALGLLFVIGGVMAFAWPGRTFVVLARLVSWFLVFLGTFEIIESLAYRWDMWWLRFVGGIASIAIGFWAAESLARSAEVLVLWVGISALMRGLSHLFLAFEFRHIHEEAKDAAGPVPEQIDLTEREAVRTT